MSVFEYIIGIHSIVLGLATASVLSTIAEQIKYRQNLQLYWVHSLWCVTLLFFILSGWWGFWYTFEKLQEISIFTFLYSFQFSIVMYICARLLSPDPTRESELSSIEEYYFRIKTPFLLFLLYGNGTWAIAGYIDILPVQEPDDPTVMMLGTAVFALIILAAVIFKNRWVQGGVVVAVLLIQILGEASQGAISL